jgi:crossover junction endodeoxyribonuclease RuvC
MIIGIDPGVTGAIAFLEDDGSFVEVFDMPTKVVGKKNFVNPQELTESLDGSDWYSRATVFLEKVHSMPGQGVASMFNFGMGYGIIQGVLAGLGMECTLVTPQGWKKRAGLIGQDKDKARLLAIGLFPEAADQLQRKKDIGRADALLIAEFGGSDD